MIVMLKDFIADGIIAALIPAAIIAIVVACSKIHKGKRVKS